MHWFFKRRSQVAAAICIAVLVLLSLVAAKKKRVTEEPRHTEKTHISCERFTQDGFGQDRFSATFGFKRSGCGE